jgi:hypothetical protein
VKQGDDFDSHITLGDGSVHRCLVDIFYLLELSIFANQALSGAECGHNSDVMVRFGPVLQAFCDTYLLQIVFTPTLLRHLSIFQGSELIGLHATCSASCTETHIVRETVGSRELENVCCASVGS